MGIIALLVPRRPPSGPVAPMAPNTDINVLLGDRWVGQGPRFPPHSLDVRPPPQEADVMMAMMMTTMFFQKGQRAATVPGFCAARGALRRARCD